MAGGLVDNVDDRSADEVAEPDGGKREPRARAPHAIRRLVVKKLKNSDVREHVGDPEREVLRHQPKHAHRDGGLGVVEEAVLFRRVGALHLHECRDDHRHDREDQPDGDALQERDAPVEPREPAGERDEEPVVERHKDGHHDQREEGDGGRRELEVFADLAVHCRALLDRVRLELCEHHVHDDGARPDRHQLHHRLRFFDLRHGASPPSALRNILVMARAGDGGRVVHHSRSVEAPACNKRCHVVTNFDGVSHACHKRGAQVLEPI